MKTTVWNMPRPEDSSHNAYIDGFVQGRRNSIANALELLLSCTKPLIYQSVHRVFISLGKGLSPV